ncbi:MAG: DUF2341 domain-containing protein, partial [Methanoregula sp.]|nr:DUF2341 domain-containing protein [Methanoregula sp.]
MKKKSPQRLLLALICAVILLMGAASAEDWSGSFSGHYRAYVAGTPTALTDYQVKFVVYNTTGTNSAENIYLSSIAQPTYNDVRFALINGTSLNYWMETPTGTNNAIFWVKVPSIPTGSDNSVAIDIYYGNATIASDADGDATFALFDNFDGSSVNTTKWQVSGSGTATVSNSILTLKKTYLLTSNKAFENNASVRVYGNLYGYNQYMGFRDSTGTNATLGSVSSTRVATLATYLSSTYSSVSSGVTITNSYQPFEISWNSTNSSLQIGSNSPVTGPTPLGSPLNAVISSQIATTARTAYYDWIFVRQLADTEPSVYIPDTAPAAAFSAAATSGDAPLTVQFSDASTGSSTTWAWDFNNDGVTDSTSPNPTYTYSVPGTYSVSLTVSNVAGSNSVTKTDYITATTPSPPTAAFSADVVTGTAPLTVSFTDESVGGVTAWAWDFNNDGVIDNTTRDATYTYSTTGNYSVNLTVTNAGGSDYAVKLDYITVAASSTIPVAAFTANLTSGTAPMAVTFTDASTGTLTAWAWDFGDGSTSTLKNPDHTYITAGKYSINLTVTGPDGSNSLVKTDFITVTARTSGIDLSGTATYATAFAHYNNTITGTITNSGTEDATAFNISLLAGLNSMVVSVPSLAAGNSTTFNVTDIADRYVNDTVTLTLTVDPDNAITESNETNNEYTTTATMIYNGYAGHRWSSGEDLTTRKNFDIRGDMIFSQGDSTYGSDTAAWTAANLPIPSGATVKDARLYVPYCWDWQGNMLGTTTMTFNGVVVPFEVHYREQKNWGDWGQYGYGVFIFNVTDQFNTSGNSASFSHEYAPLRGMNLVVTYQDANATEKQIFINDGFDMLFAASSYYTTPETATAYAPFTGAEINMSKVKTATLTTSVTRGSGWGTMLFNGSSWPNYWLSGAGEVGIGTTDVTSYLAATNNTALLRCEDTGKGIEAYLAILKVEYNSEAGVPVAAFTASPTTGAYPLTVQFIDSSNGIPDSWSWDFGDGDTTNATVQNPVHTYSSAGTYAVNLTVSNSYGTNSINKTSYIRITSSSNVPVANFTADTFSGLAPLTVQFTDSSSNTPTAWKWEYRSSGTTDSWTSFATTQNPSYSFASGVYDIRLTATNGDGSGGVTKIQYLSSSGGPKRLATVQSGTVSGDLYVGAYQSWSNQTTRITNTFNKSFALPAYTSIQWARLYTAVYGSSPDNRTGTATVRFDGNGDGTYETTLGTETLATTSTSTADVYPVNDHVNKQYTDYLIWYDVTSLISSQNPRAEVVATPVSSSFDARIKELVLVVAYNDGDSDQVKYWVNDGHDYQVSSDTGAVTTTFATSSLASGWTSATLQNVGLSSQDAIYTINGNSLTRQGSGLPSFETNSWDVNTSLTAGSDTSFAYLHNTSSPFKTTLATLAVKYPASSIPPVPAFSANVTSGRVPLTVGFSDTTTGSPIAWSWTFGDGDTSTMQNPNHTYLSAGTYPVSLTATGLGGTNTTTVTNAITVTSLSSDSYYGGIPLTTVQNGTVTGGLWYDAYPGFAPSVSKSFTLPTYTAIKWARLYVDVYCGSETANNRGTATVKVDGNNDGTYEIQKSETFNTSYSLPGESGTGPVWINNHMNRVTSDYLMWYDLTGAINGNTVNVQAATADIDTSFDGRIKTITLVVAYDNGSTDTVKYWVNQGHDTVYPKDATYHQYTGSTSFGTSKLSDGWNSANLTAIYLASVNGIYTFHGQTLDPGTPQGAYFGTNTWDITGLLTAGQDSTLGYTRYNSSTYFKIPLALMSVRYTGNATYNPPVAKFSTTQTSTPLTVKFTDESTNSPTNWSWNFGDGNTSAETNPVHTFPGIGTYPVNLTVSNSAGTSSTEKSVIASENAGGIDLSVTSLAPNGNAGDLFANEPNNVTATIKNIGTAAAGPFVVRVSINDNSTETSVAGLESGSSTSLVITDPVIRANGDVVAINITADTGNTINETSKTNNQYNLTKTVLYNGYKGKRYTSGNDVTTNRSYDIHGNLVYSSGDSQYKSGTEEISTKVYWSQYTVKWTAADLPVPSGAKILEARLYVPYTWDNSNEAPDRIHLTFNGQAESYQSWYHDQSNFGTYPNYVYGLLTYDVTSDFKANTQNSATLTRDNSATKISPYGFTLAIVYEDASASRKQIFLNEEFDLLGADSTSYATTPEEATAYVPFTGPDIDTNVTQANLITFVPSGNGPEGDLLFNGNTIATGVWEYLTNTQVAVDTRDVKSYLTATGNIAGIRSTATSHATMAAA